MENQFPNQQEENLENQVLDDANEKNQLLNLKFENRDDLLLAVREFYAAKGYVLTTRGSRPNKFVILHCDRGGLYRDTRRVPYELRKRSTGSRLIGFPFEIKGEKQEDGFWMVEIKNLSHNHEPSSNLFGHPFSRRLSLKELTSVKQMSQSGAPPRQILTSFRQQDPTLRAVSRTIYNAKEKIRRDNLEGRTLIQALFEELGKGGFIYNYLQNQDGQLTHLFFAYPLSIELTKSFSDVFVMDYTYKTNRYKMPLLDIVGVSSFNSSFYSCFVFLEREAEEDYFWALEMFSKVLGADKQPSVIVSDRALALMNAITVVFSTTVNILCIWHINKNIQGKCKGYFDTQEASDSFLSYWCNVVASTDVDSFEKSWSDLEFAYEAKRDAIGYIKKTWLPFKEKFVAAWTDKHLHFGNQVSSRVEATHAKLKKYLQVSTGDLYEVKKNICLAIENEFQEITTQLAAEKIRVPHHCNIPAFKNIIYHVSVYALKELMKQYEKIKQGTFQTTCSETFTATMGLPCAHQMMKQKMIALDMINKKWRIDLRSLPTDNMVHSDDDQMKELIKEFQDEYMEWPLNKKEIAREKLKELVRSSPIISEPIVRLNRSKILRSKKKNNLNNLSSTRRDPSYFEIVESSRLGGPSHISTSCNTIDLNVLPDITND